MVAAEEIERIHWIKRWAGSYTFISCSYWGEQYFFSLKRELGVQFNHVLFIHAEGTVSFSIPKEEYEHFGITLAQRISANPALAMEWLEDLKKNSDKITEVMKRLSGKIPSWEEYQEFLLYFEKHLPLHNFMKKTVDFLPPDTSIAVMDSFRDARVYSEHVYSDTERFFRGIMATIGKQENRSGDLLTCMTQVEFEAFLKTGELPDDSILQTRFEKSGLYFTNGEQLILTGSEVTDLEKALFASLKNTREIKGVSAFPGVVQGKARIVPDPLSPGEFDEGDILVTGMTRPEFLPLIKKASAIVTDAGGVLCHAAIVARELHKPCIVGTEIATKVLKDGDIVEVDANAGIVKILKRAT